MEANFDGIVGPTHNYAGLSHGNVASDANRRSVSYPRAAALEGLRKMRYLHDLGLVQGVLPPQERPHVEALRKLGFTGGSDGQIIADAARTEPVLLALCSSASSMWAANAATVAPSADTPDGRVHFTPANLQTTFHRALEVAETTRALRRIFASEAHFKHHDALMASHALGDEGAANHVWLNNGSSARGVHLLVYGRNPLEPLAPAPSRYPARQTLAASQAIARRHGLAAQQVVFAQQNPSAIDAGVFHNDVISVGNGPVLLYHEHAFLETEQVLEAIDRALEGAFVRARVGADELTFEEAVKSYLFNSQIVTLPEGSMALIAPIECNELERARNVIERLLQEDNPIRSVHFLDVRQSMKNGGGPACLRLRVWLTDDELRAVHPPCLFNEVLHERLEAWVMRHYRDTLAPDDLADPFLLEESRAALDELTQILALGPDFYRFQRVS